MQKSLNDSIQSIRRSIEKAIEKEKQNTFRWRDLTSRMQTANVALRGVTEAAQANGVAMPATAVVSQLLNSLVSSGGGELDYSALATVLFGLAGLNDDHR